LISSICKKKLTENHFWLFYRDISIIILLTTTNTNIRPRGKNIRKVSKQSDHEPWSTEQEKNEKDKNDIYRRQFCPMTRSLYSLILSLDSHLLD
jgi:hypothetical protein